MKWEYPLLDINPVFPCLGEIIIIIVIIIIIIIIIIGIITFVLIQEIGFTKSLSN